MIKICVLALELICPKFWKYLSEWDKKITFDKIIAKLGGNKSYSIIIIKLIYHFRSVLFSHKIVDKIFRVTVIGSETWSEQ